jgi:hypothetical protein
MCKWWQSHKWDKWEYETTPWVRQYCYRANDYHFWREIGTRYCTRCGEKQVKTINEWGRKD